VTDLFLIGFLQCSMATIQTF